MFDNHLPPLQDFYVLVSVDENGNEGVCGKFLPSVGWISMTVGDKKLVEILLQAGNELCKTTGTQFKILQFSQRTELHVINPS